MRPTPTSAFRPRLNFTVALGLGIISSTAVGCVATPSSAEPPSRVKAKTVEVVATNGETVVVIDGERHVGEVRMDQASEMMMLVDGDAQVRQFPIPAGALRGWSSNNEPGRNRPRAVMLTGSEPPRARLGISMAETDAGVLVEGVMPGTAAERSGLREGDVIVAIGGDREDMRSVDTSALSELISNRSPGETVRMKIVRGDEILTLSSTLGVADNSAGSGGNDLEGHQIEAIARQIEAQIREMLGDQAGDGEIVMNFEFNEEFDEDDRHEGRNEDDRHEGRDEDDRHEGRDEDDRHEGRNELWEEMFRYVEGMMEEAHHETAGWMEDMAEHAGHWAEEAEHRLHEFAEMSDHRMHEFAETFEHELQRVMERQEEGRHETEMMFRERDLDLRERGMEFQDRLRESNRNLQETLQRFAEQNQQLAKENRRLNERVGRLEQAFRNLMGGSRDSDARNGDEQRRRMIEEAKRSERQNAEEMKQRAVERMQRSAERGEKAEQRRRKASDRSQQRGAARGKKPAKDSERDRD